MLPYLELNLSIKKAGSHLLCACCEVYDNPYFGVVTGGLVGN